MPMPVSWTEMATGVCPSGPSSRRTVTDPSCVNLSALPTRLMITCLSLAESVSTDFECSGTSATSATLPSFTLACPSSWPTVSVTRCARSTGSMISSIRPASTLARSSTSLISSRRCFPLARTRSRKFRSLSWRRPSRFFRRMLVKPMIELSGVRSSWLMLARKSLLALLAASASSFATRRASSALTRGVTSFPNSTAPWMPSSP